MRYTAFIHDDYDMIDWFRAMSLPANVCEPVMSAIRWMRETLELRGYETTSGNCTLCRMED